MPSVMKLTDGVMYTIISPADFTEIVKAKLGDEAADYYMNSAGRVEELEEEMNELESRNETLQDEKDWIESSNDDLVTEISCLKSKINQLEANQPVKCGECEHCVDGQACRRTYQKDGFYTEVKPTDYCNYGVKKRPATSVADLNNS